MDTQSDKLSIEKTKNDEAYDINSINTLGPQFRPRYSLADTVSLNHKQNNWRHNSYICSHLRSWCCCFCSFLCDWVCSKYNFSSFFATRRKSLIFILTLASISFLVHVTFIRPLATVVVHFKDKNALSDRQSYGLLTSIPNDRWQIMKENVQNQRRKREKVLNDFLNRYDSSQQSTIVQNDFDVFFKTYYGREFTCPEEKSIGKSGKKFLCTPDYRSETSQMVNNTGGNSCLVYSSFAEISSSFSFERDLLDEIGPCEIHVFHPNKKFGEPELQNMLIDKIHFHSWGFGKTRSVERNSINPFGKKDASQNKNNDSFKSIEETIRILGHKGKMIDIFMIDCEGCEWDIFQEWFQTHHGYQSSTLMQVLVTLHGVPSVTNDFFSNFQNHGYVISHRSPIMGTNGEEQEYSFLKLSPSFFLQ